MCDKDFELAVAKARLFQFVKGSSITLPAGFCPEVPVPARFPVEQPVLEIRAKAQVLSQVIDNRWSERGDGSVKDRIVMRVVFGLRHWNAYRSIVAAERAILALFVLTDEKRRRNAAVMFGDHGGVESAEFGQLRNNGIVAFQAL